MAMRSGTVLVLLLLAAALWTTANSAPSVTTESTYVDDEDSELGSTTGEDTEKVPIKPSTAKDGDSLMVKVIVANTPPSSFTLTPPSYSAASELTLSCVVEAPNGGPIEEGITYEWVSTCLGCSVTGLTSEAISIPYLSSHDTGTYMCKAQDLAGCKGNASVTINVAGSGIYAESADDVIPNNGIITTGSFHCISGSKTSEVGGLVNLDGKDIIATSKPTNLTISQGLADNPGTLFVENVDRLMEYEVGVYTCLMPDETGKTVEKNIGLYTNATARTPVVSAIHAMPLSKDTYQLTCVSLGSPPTEVAWEKEGEVIDVAGSNGYYVVGKVLVNRTTSMYNNTLTMEAGVEDVLGEYSCVVTNTLGRSNKLTKNITAMNVSGHETPVLVGLSRNITCSTHLDVVKMEWVLGGVGNPEPVSERTDGGRALVLSLAPRGDGLDGTVFMCKITSSSGMEYETAVTIQVKELANTVQISGSSNPLAAGRRHSLTCHVTSDITPTVKWVGLDGTELETGEGMIVSEPVRYGLNTTMVLTFDTLKTSHGGDYSCVSSTNYPTTEVTATRELIVQIPNPSVSLISSPETDVVYTTASLLVTCTVDVHPSADETPTNVIMSLSDISDYSVRELTLDSSYTDVEVTSDTNGTRYSITAYFTSLSSYSSPDVRFVCTAHVQPNTTTPHVVSSSNVTAQHSIHIGLEVIISISYTAPDEYPDYAPPNYRTASSVTLTCSVPGAVGYITYSWSSTCESCFASSGSGRTVSDTFLKANDAGNHTCTVSDAYGNTGNASIEMNIYGVGINFYTYAYGCYGSGNNPNNTYAVVSTSRYRTERLGFYCCSNTTTPPSASLRLPSGTLYSSSFYDDSQTSHSNSFFLTRYTSGVYAGCLKVSISSSYYSYFYLSYAGVYTCQIPDARGTTQEAAVGIYTYSTSLSSYGRAGTYRIPSTEALTIGCQTSGQPPANLIWYKNSVNINSYTDIDFKVSYQVIDYSSSIYNNSLLVTGSADQLAGVYTCRYRSITITGLVASASVDHTDLSIGTSIDLTCGTDLDVTTVEWYRGDTRVASNNGNASLVITHELVRDVDDGLVYRCVAIGPYARQEKNITLSVTIPVDWASVEVSSTSESPLNNTHFSLTCAATIVPGLDLPITVEWVGPDGVVMTSEGNRVLGEKEVEGTMRTLSLTFDPILASNGGDYTCRVSIFANWTKSQPPQHAVTVHIPVITQNLFQLRLYPLPLCVNWDVNMARDLESSIKRDVEKAVRERCDCDFSDTAIYSGEFSCQFTNCDSNDCDRGTHVTYRAILNGTSDLLSANELTTHMLDWRELSGTLLYNFFRLKLASISECGLTIDSFEDEVC